MITHARAGDADDVLRKVDHFCYQYRFMMNVGDEKGAILDRIVQRTHPQKILEIGAYCGYSALRMARAMPDARVCSVEYSTAHAAIARRIWQHAGIEDRVTIVVGTLDDPDTLEQVRQKHQLVQSGLDLVFLDHNKDRYVPDLERIEHQGGSTPTPW